MSWIAELNTFVSDSLQTGAGPWVVVILFLGGLLAALLPCVYPLYPITATVLRQRAGSDSSRGRLHPLFYFFGLACMYALFGLIAGLSGGAFNQLLRYPETNLVIAAIIFTLGLSSVELLHIPLFGGDAGSRVPPGLFGSFLFGMGAGFLSSPCVGPVVVTVLVEITTSTEQLSLLKVTEAMLKMFIFGLGLGLPFLAVGVFGVRLPRSGVWLRIVQIILGAVVFYFAASFYWKGMRGLAFSDTTALRALVLLGIALVLFVLVQDRSRQLHERVERALLWGAIAVALLSLASLLMTNRTLPVEPAFREEAPVHVAGNLTWFRQPEDALNAARETGQNIFIDFWAEWCTNCHEFERLTESDQRLNQGLQEAVLLRIEDTDPIFAEYMEDPRFPELKVGLPFFVVLDPQGRMLYKTSDYLAHDQMIRNIRKR